VMMADAPAVGVLAVVINHHLPIFRGPMPPLVTLCHRLGSHTVQAFAWAYFYVMMSTFAY
jgi:hypothetical protein